MLRLILIAAIPLETIRMIIIGGEMKKLALQKGEPPAKWVIAAVSIWIGIEISLVVITALLFGWVFVIVGLFIGIMIATIIYRIIRGQLRKLPDKHWEDRIEEIGKENVE